jgi:SpoVK/Ycf46/Vps4 family AAA+-type ATPase
MVAAPEVERVGFGDVIGLEDVKEEVRMKAIWPLLHRELAQEYGLPLGGGVLLYGPPGTGKTLLARAVASEVNAPFRAISPADLLTNEVGQAERNVRALFDWARRQRQVVLFIDEMEALAPARRKNRSTIMARVVPQILQEMQGVTTAGGKILIIGATNEPWSLDPAILRPGRLDAVIYVPLPGPRERARMLRKFLAGRPVEDALDLDDLAERLDGYSGADIARVCELAARFPFKEAARREGQPPRRIGMEDLIRAAEQTSPSVTREELRRFEHWHRQCEVCC